MPNSVLTCGWFSPKEDRAQIHRLDGRMDTSQYLQLLAGALTGELRNDGVNFIHDHHPVHKSRVVAQWFRENDFVHVLPWPKNFGSIMPMETVWDDMLQRLEGTTVSSTEELWENVCLCFTQLCSNDYLKTVTSQIPNKLLKIIETNSLM